ncbi:hypothetical protein [Desulfogranum mediterraneum]|uniref:hypothetical protein n=1 Tax=Desulfogranum mediterraneum TaxID=160661 RepID=UPI0004115950|nr:hypothetical protein [Desulfogranum mediterraneum]
MQPIIDFFNHPFFICVGGVMTAIAVISFIITLLIVAKGIIPVWYRLGMGLAKRKIAILADAQSQDLKDLLIDSKLFNEKNIFQVNNESLKKAESATMILVHWKPFESRLDEILSIKKDSDALIIYAPQKEGFINDEEMTKLSSQRNTIIVNFRGRLLNDIYTSMITTSYAKG